MGRPKKKQKNNTVPVRVPKDLIENLREELPEDSDPQRIEKVYKKSLFSLENLSRELWGMKKNKKKKNKYIDEEDLI